MRIWRVLFHIFEQFEEICWQKQILTCLCLLLHHSPNKILRNFIQIPHFFLFLFNLSGDFQIHLQAFLDEPVILNLCSPFNFGLYIDSNHLFVCILLEDNFVVWQIIQHLEKHQIVQPSVVVVRYIFIDYAQSPRVYQASISFGKLSFHALT